MNVYVPTDDDEQVTEDPLIDTVNPLLTLLFENVTEAPDGDDEADAVKVTDEVLGAFGQREYGTQVDNLRENSIRVGELLGEKGEVFHIIFHFVVCYLVVSPNEGVQELVLTANHVEIHLLA